MKFQITSIFNRLKLLFYKPFVPFWLLLMVLTLLSQNHVFFWDTIQLASKHGHWYYENAFQYFLLPLEIDSGHIPAFGMYIAVCWLLFGKSLAVSHLAMLPFLLGIGYYLYRIGKLMTEEKRIPFLLLLLLVDPVFIGQSVLVSPDIALLCFFLMALLGILDDSKGLKWVGLTALPTVSMRGMMMVLGLFLWEMWREWRVENGEWRMEKGEGRREKEVRMENLEGRSKGRGLGKRIREWIFYYLKKGWQKVPWYIPGGIISLAFLFYHYQQTGWIGYHPESPWAVSYERVDAKGVIKNIAVLAWRFLDFGRVFIWLGMGIGGLLLWRLKRIKQLTKFDIAPLFIILLLVLSVPMLSHKAILAHRYLLPVFVLLNLLFYQIWFDLLVDQKNWVRIVFTIAVLGLITGNLWVYPKKVAQGWDSTLAHWPHYQLRSEMIDYIEQTGIPFSEVGTAFPEIGPFKFKDLSEIEDGFATKDLKSQSYILYANTMNDFTDEEIDALEKDWEVVHKIQKGGIYFVLYKALR